MYASVTRQARINRDFKRQLDNSDNNEGLYHCLPSNMKQSLSKFTIDEAPAVRAKEEIVLNKQRRHKQNRQAVLRRNKLLCA